MNFVIYVQDEECYNTIPRTVCNNGEAIERCLVTKPIFVWSTTQNIIVFRCFRNTAPGSFGIGMLPQVDVLKIMVYL